MQKILINTIINKAGGGQKVAFNFVNGLSKYFPCESIIVLCIENSPIHQLLKDSSQIEVHTVKDMNTIQRIAWEISFGRAFLRKIQPDIIYTIFGYPLFPKKYIQVIGEADSNLFFPEIDFWQDYSKSRRIIKALIDTYRKIGLRRADGVIFENATMEKRSHQLYHLSPERTCYIKPSLFDLPDEVKSQSGHNGRPFRLLLLCGWQRNKNFMILPAVLEHLKSQGVDAELYFSVSADETCDEYCIFYRELQERKVENQVKFLDRISPEKLPQVYAEVDAVLLLSRLESFSNNIIEAWKYERPLVISDAEWSRELVGDAAIFVNRDEVKSIASAIRTLAESPEARQELVMHGRNTYATYPDIEGHARQVLIFLEKIYNESNS